MEQVAHQAVVMQFILEMARNAQQDPRGCFRQFFQKAKVSVHSDSPAAVHCNAAEISPSFFASLCYIQGCSCTMQIITQNVFVCL